MTVFDQKHGASQAARATMNVRCAVCRTNVRVENSKRMTVTTIVVEGGGGRKRIAGQQVGGVEYMELGGLLKWIGELGLHPVSSGAAAQKISLRTRITAVL